MTVTRVSDLHGRHRRFLNTIVTLVNEVRTDHGTNKTALDAIETLIEELAADHATNKTVIDELISTMNELISTTGRDQVVHGTGAGLAIKAGGNADAKSANAITIQHKGLEYAVAATDPIDISALTGGGDPITQNTSGVLWVFANSSGIIDGETPKAAADYGSAVAALADYSNATNTLPPGTDDVPIGAIMVTEDNSGAFTWGTGALDGESAASYYSFTGLPGIEVQCASAAIDATAPTFTYGAATLRLGSGTRVAATGKANVTISGTNVSTGDVGVWFLYVLADDTEVAYQFTDAGGTLADAQAAVRDHTPNPLLPVVVVMYVQNESGSDFEPGTTNLDATGITVTFARPGPGSAHVELGRAALNQPHQVIQNASAATLSSSNPASGPATISASAVSTLT